ncbi:Golgi transport complex subunit 6 [Tilletia horrida]|uniref:Conserved oligomeric Golgi complex subunit 6 n=1 Tax=Tilletia horrida TaxID=155126 RepID=A0AAN6GVW1_9BASI|nr:Golgi transport complex subunit 6 [Tilletia horrida]KAK0569314.1 Golgi transport complex subunit 6 [Tilletia horrida]
MAAAASAPEENGLPSFSLSVKLRQVLADVPNPDSVRDALAAIAYLYPSPSSSSSRPVDITRARKNVLDDLDAHLLSAAQQVHSAYAPAVAAIDQLTPLIDDIVAESERIHSQFEGISKDTANVLSESESLQKQRTTLSWQSGQVAAFLKKYSLSDAELLILNNPAAAEAAAVSQAARSAASSSNRRNSVAPPIESVTTTGSHGIGRPLFDVIDRLEHIRQDCAELLGLIEEEEEEVEDQPETQAHVGKPEAKITSPKEQPTSLASALPITRDPSQKKDMMRAGMHILRLTSEQLNTAHSRLARWCTFEFRQPFREGVEVSPIMREAVQRLAEGGREDLLGPALSTLTQTRSTALTQAFNTALTQGGPPPSYLPRPIELSAHDPTRYVGDMLAWVHQALASERELLGSLVGVGDDDEADAAHELGAVSSSMSPSSRSQQSQSAIGRRIGQRRRWSVNPAEVIDMMQGSDDAAAASSNTSEALAGSLALASARTAQKGIIRPRERLRDLLDRDLEGCCRPLKVRVTQTLQSQEGSITAFKLASLIGFYSSTMDQTIGKSASLSGALRDLTTAAYSAFFSNLERQANGLAKFVDPPESDLAPPPPLFGASSTLKELLALHLSAKEEDALFNTDNGGKSASDPISLNDFTHVTTRLVEPILKMVDRMAEALRLAVARRSLGSTGYARLGVSFAGRGSGSVKPSQGTEVVETWEEAVFLANCWSHVLTILRPYDFVESTVQDVTKRVDSKAEVLSDLYYKYLLNQSGLAGILPADSPAGSTEEVTLSTAQAEKSLDELDKFLASPTALIISHPALKKLQPADLRNGIHARSLAKLADAYQFIYSRYSEADATKGSIVLRRTPEEVRLLLGAGHSA